MSNMQRRVLLGCGVLAMLVFGLGLPDAGANQPGAGILVFESTAPGGAGTAELHGRHTGNISVSSVKVGTKVLKKGEYDLDPPTGSNRPRVLFHNPPAAGAKVVITAKTANSNPSHPQVDWS